MRPRTPRVVRRGGGGKGLTTNSTDEGVDLGDFRKSYCRITTGHLVLAGRNARRRAASRHSHGRGRRPDALRGRRFQQAPSRASTRSRHWHRALRDHRDHVHRGLHGRDHSPGLGDRVRTAERRLPGRSSRPYPSRPSRSERRGDCHGRRARRRGSLSSEPSAGMVDSAGPGGSLRHRRRCFRALGGHRSPKVRRRARPPVRGPGRRCPASPSGRDRAAARRTR